MHGKYIYSLLKIYNANSRSRGTMKIRSLAYGMLVCILPAILVIPALAQEVTGALGSPNAQKRDAKSVRVLT